MSRLLHYTSTHHLEMIRRDGFIRPSESNIDMFANHIGPDVVWLTSDKRWQHDWARGSAVDKCEVRIVVEIDDAQWWPRWSREHGIESFWFDALDRGGGYMSHTWYVVEHAVSDDQWIEVETRE